MWDFKHTIFLSTNVLTSISSLSFPPSVVVPLFVGLSLMCVWRGVVWCASFRFVLDNERLVALGSFDRDETIKIALEQYVNQMPCGHGVLYKF